MKVAVIGSRNPTDAMQWSVAHFVSALPQGTIVVSGGAHGIDLIAELLWRYDFEEQFIRYCPDYKKYHFKVAPLERNKLIAAECDELHAWPSQDSRGTWHCAKYAASLNKPVFIHLENADVYRM